MRKFFIGILAFAASAMLSAQEGRIVERTFVSTDRSAYVAGDNVWCSAFCIDVTDGGRLSDFSSVCYVELVSPDGVAATCKIALENGRGAGQFRIPLSTPTGNYRLLAYTAVNRNEQNIDYVDGSRVISIYNTLANKRADCVRLGTAPSVQAAEPAPCAIKIYAENGKVIVENGGDEQANLSLSVACQDRIPSPQSIDIQGFVDKYADGVEVAGFSNDWIPEYDGEIVYVKVPESFEGSSGFISSPGDNSNIYTSEVEAGGLLTFFTGNIYGETNMVLQVDASGADGDYEFEVESPFVDPEVREVPELYLSEEMEEDLLRRSLSMQIGDKFGTSVLSSRLPSRPNLLFSANELASYNLDDYTRFQTFKEVFVEYVKEASVRKNRICVVINDVVLFNSLQASVSNTALVLLDGVPILDHSIVLDMDPNLVKRLDIYQRSVAVGSRVYGGVVNFVTLREDMAGVKLPDSARMLDFSGVCYPMALTGEQLDENYPDYRQTLLWQPLLKLAPGEKAEFDCRLPAYEGRFVIEAVGMTDSGRALSARGNL